MSMKNLGIREWLVVAFIVVGLGAFAFEDYFKPKIYSSQVTVQGFNLDEVPIVLDIKAYKKGNGDLRVTEIIATHEETEAIGAVAIQKLIDDVRARQNFEQLDIIAGATVSSQAFIDGLRQALDDIKSQS